MTMSPATLIHHSNLFHRRVTDQSDSEKLGRVTQVWLDYRDHKVLGFTCQSGLWDNTACTFPWEQIAAIEAQQILMKAIPSNHQSVTLNLELKRMTAVDTQISHEVWTQSGNYIGMISNCRIFPYSGVVKDYILIVRSLRQLTIKQFYLPSSMIIDVGRGWIMVPDRVMQEIELVEEKRVIDGTLPPTWA